VLAQSNAHTQGGFPFSLQITAPANTFSNGYTELIPVAQGGWYNVNSWVYNAGTGGNVFLVVDWYDQNQVHINSGVVFSPGTGTLNAFVFLNVNAQAPATAAYGRLGVTNASTSSPAVNTFASDAIFQLADPPVLSDVLAITYDSGGTEPTGVTQLS